MKQEEQHTMQWMSNQSIQQEDDLQQIDDQATSELEDEDVQEASTEAVVVVVEARLRDESTVDPKEVCAAVERLICGRQFITYADGPLELSSDDAETAAFLQNHVLYANIVDTNPAAGCAGYTVTTDRIRVQVYCYWAHDEEPADDDEGEDGVPSYRELLLPNVHLEGSWATLYYDSTIKQRLLQYATSALLFAEHNVNPHLVAWNRVVLLHGPPGTGKTSLCKGLAHKLAVRFSHRFRAASMVEVNAHSLFSKWFSESGKQVSKLFSRISELLDEPDVLVFVLIDEIESLAAARKAGGGSEPSDAVRAVNALLTQLDQLKRYPNTMVLTTSNITEAIDVAFVDRADIKAYIGPPTTIARYEMLRGSVTELVRAGLISTGDGQSQLWPFHRLQHNVLAIAPSALPNSITPSTQHPSQIQTQNETEGSDGHLQQPSRIGKGTKRVATQQETDVPGSRCVLLDNPASNAGTEAMQKVIYMKAAEKISFGRGMQLMLSDRADLEPEDRSGMISSALLLQVADQCEGLSGRSLRKLPFLAHALQEALPVPCPLDIYLDALQYALHRELTDRSELGWNQ